MDRYGGRFGAYDDPYEGVEPLDLDILSELDSGIPPVAPPSPVGQDERRMQVRAYNHWAALLGDASYPPISALHPEALEDFGPYGVLLHFGGPGGIEDPAIRFLGAKLAEECGCEGGFARLSQVPGRSLLSRITDHYMQILANQAPIGFEAEFTNQQGANVLYRGILLPWSEHGEAIDYIFGVINWKEMADAATADALLAAIDAGFAAPIPLYEGIDMDRMLDLTGFEKPDEEPEPAAALPSPAFGTPLDLTEELTEPAAGWDDEDDDGAWGASFAGFGAEDTVYAVDYGAQGLEDGEADEDVDGVVDPLAEEDDVGLGLASLVSRTTRVKQSVVLPGMEGAPVPALAPLPVPQAYEPEPEREPIVAAAAPQPTPPAPAEEPDGLYDCLAAARELAQTARSSEDRGRKALYQAVARAYDFSLEAAANPEDFGELLAENGLTVQDRAPMTPIVKLVFGADYDKTRLTEYATVLCYAHRTDVARGTLDSLLASAEGGLKGVVQAERRARKDGSENAPAPRTIRAGLAKKLRKLDPVALADLEPEGAEFALVMVRRLPSGELAGLGEVPEDVALIEKAARKLLP
ncbi:hypothetical protein [Qipengyuania sediminis]|uniref:hypothetical protein n=1 Tax=Qipengyuania sediminis TaxID=1532023 RepID=UPI00105A87EF|nr:hypothetical protein [Qipengyuania sediminis]